MPHGFKKHLKRVNAPSSWMLDKMGGVFAPRPSSGPHKIRESIPLVLVLRQKLHLALDGREATQICKRREVLVDGRVRTDNGFPAGFMDVITLPKASLAYRVLYDTKGRFTLKALEPEEATFKLCKVSSKKLGEKKIPLIGTVDGRTIRYPDPKIKVGDSIKLDIETGKILDVLPLVTGATCMVFKGRNTGRVGTLVHRERHLGSFDIAQLKDAKGQIFAVRLGAVFVVSHVGQPVQISLPKGDGIKVGILGSEGEAKTKA